MTMTHSDLTGTLWRCSELCTSGARRRWACALVTCYDPSFDLIDVVIYNVNGTVETRQWRAASLCRHWIRLDSDRDGT